MAGKNKKFYWELKSGWAVWAAGIAALLFGLALLIWPGITAGLILNICGIGLMIAGLFNIVRYFFQKAPYAAYNWNLGFGLAITLAGIALVAFKGALLSVVPILFGIGLLIGGVIKIQAAFNLQRMGFGQWYLTLIGAAVSCVLGALIMANPFGTGLVLVRVIGASIVVEAVQDLISIRNYDRVIKTYFVK